jgi:hypothetical protein
VSRGDLVAGDRAERSGRPAEVPYPCDLPRVDRADHDQRPAGRAHEELGAGHATGKSSSPRRTHEPIDYEHITTASIAGVTTSTCLLFSSPDLVADGYDVHSVIDASRTESSATSHARQSSQTPPASSEYLYLDFKPIVNIIYNNRSMAGLARRMRRGGALRCEAGSGRTLVG